MELQRDREIGASGTSGVTPEQFKAVFRNHAAGVALVTADAGDGPVALTATSVFSISVVPPLLVFSVSELSSSAPTLKASETVVAHILSADQLHLAQLGATSGIDRFADTSLWSRLPTGEPYFPGARSWVRGTVIERIAAGTSTVIVVEALTVHSDDPDGGAETEPLVYHNRGWHRLGDASRIEE